MNHMSSVRYYVSGVMCQVSGIRNHMSIPKKKKYKVLGIVGADLLNISNTTNSVGVKFSGLA